MQHSNPVVEISLNHDSEAERQTKIALLNLMKKYDLRDWFFTHQICLDETCIPHSHPVLTLHTVYRQNEMLLLATLLHEQLHWFEEKVADRRDLAIEETKRYYAEVPCELPEGASDEQSTRLHLLVCYLELQALKQIVGTQSARRTIEIFTQSHYRWVYRTVLRDEKMIEAIIRKYDLLPDGLHDRITETSS